MGWGEAEIAKKVNRYLTKAAGDPELLTMGWEKMTQELIQRMMHAYAHACGEADWFFSIDLCPVFFVVLWEMISGTGQQVDQDAVYEAITVEYEDKLDRVLLDKAMWETTKNVCSEIYDEKVLSKIFHALSKGYFPAIDAMLEEKVVYE